MERKDLDFVLKANQYLEGGTKEACIKVRDFLRYIKNPGNQIHSPLSCVTADEFVEAVKVLMAFTFRQEDTIPERWTCENDCQLANRPLCPGEFNISKTVNRVCPHFIDEGEK